VGNKIWAGIKGAFVGAVGWFLKFVITPITAQFQEIKDAFSYGIGSGIRAVIDSIRGPLNEMIDALNGVMGALGLGWHINEIPYLAKGGIATGPTLAMVGEGSQHEAIAPLDKLQSFISTAVLSAMKVSGGGGGGANIGGDIILNIDGRQIGRILKPILDKEAMRVGKNIRMNLV
jgi:hypothetical protein